MRRWAQADLEEERNVFEEGNAFTMEAVQQRLDQLTADHKAQARASTQLSRCRACML